MSTNSSEVKMLPYLFNLCHNKNKEIKLNVLLCFQTILDKNQQKIKGMMFFDKYLTMLVNYITDKDADVRNASRKTFRCLL